MDVGYVWDEEKYRKVQKKHDVMFYEVVNALEDPNGFEQADEARWEEERWIWLGQTETGRLLVVVYSDEELPLCRIITAFEATGRWVDEYEQRS